MASGDLHQTVGFCWCGLDHTFPQEVTTTLATPAIEEADPLFPDAEVPRSLTSYAEDWIAEVHPPEIAELNVRGFAIWADLRRKSSPPAIEEPKP